MIALSLKRTDGLTDKAYMEEVYNTIQRNMLYIRRLCKNNMDKISDVTSKVIAHAIAHRDFDQGCKPPVLDAYVNSLCKHFYTDLVTEQNKSVEYDDAIKLTQLFEDYTLNHTMCDSEGRFVVEDCLMQHYFSYPQDVINYCKQTLNALGIKMFSDDVLPQKSEIKDTVFVPQDKKAWLDVRGVMRKYDAVTTLNATLVVAQRIVTQLKRSTRRLLYTELKAQAVNYDVLQAITTSVTVVVTQGGTGRNVNKLYKIDPYTLQMIDETKKVNVDLDTVKWQPLQKSMRSVIAIDVTGLWEYLYQQICVPNVDTHFIRWLGTQNVKVLPSGTQLHNVSVEHYMLEAKAELLTTLVKYNITDIVGVSEDTVYFRPRQRIKYDVLNYKLFTGKCIQLPVTITQISVPEE